jgi:PmbA protein
LEAEDRGTGLHTNIGTVLKKNGMSTGFEDFSSRILDIDFQDMGRKAAELARKGQHPRSIDSKDMTVILTPDAFANLMEFITVPALYGEAGIRGESVYSNREEEEVASNNLSIVDDSCMPGGLNSALVDDEGVPSKRTELIKDGVLKGFLFSQGTALEYQREKTSSAMRTERLASSRSYKSIPVVKGRNITVEGEVKSRDTLVGEIDEGVLVYEILGAHTSNPASGDFSINSPILFKIENGDVAYPVKSAMLSGNFPDCLNRVNALGDDYKLVSGSLTPVSFHLPSVSLEGMRVTG